MRTVALAIASLLLCAAAAQAAPVTRCNEPITMSDGTVLRANVILPADGQRLPTVLTATGYNKDATDPTGTQCGSGGALAAPDQELIDAGYAVMLLDDRGTGASQGQWDSWSERTQQDYVEVLDWIVAQPWSDGQLGTTGGSYMGITSLLLAEADARRVAAGKPRAVKAVWADVPMSDAYRDVTFHGGAVDAGFIPLWLGLTTSLSNIPPSTTPADPAGSAPTYAQHLANTFTFAGQLMVDAALGGAAAYDGPFYRTRSPGDRAATIRVPVAWAGGWWDIFQRGEPLLYEQLSNSPRRLFFMTPNYHGAPDQAAWDALGLGPEAKVRRRWFDRWLKDTPTPELDDLAPVNLWTQGSKQWEHRSAWPLPGTDYREFYLGGDGALGTARPGADGADGLPLLPVSSPCSRLTAQWTAGAGAIGPCETDNRTFEATALTYSTPPLERDTKVTGPVLADLWATLTSADATLVAVLSDVAPSGESTQLTAGFLLASQRAVDEQRSLKSPDGRIIRPWHPFTRASQQPVPAGEPQHYLIEIYPTSNVFRAGHRIRLTLNSADTPSTLTTLPATAGEVGGQLELLRGPRHPSHVLLPLSGPEPANPLPAASRCVSQRAFTIRLRGARLRSARVTVGRRRMKVVRRSGRLYARIDLRGLPRGRYTARVRATTARGRVLWSQRSYRTCGG